MGVKNVLRNIVKVLQLRNCVVEPTNGSCHVLLHQGLYLRKTNIPLFVPQADRVCRMAVAARHWDRQYYPRATDRGRHKFCTSRLIDHEESDSCALRAAPKLKSYRVP